MNDDFERDPASPRGSRAEHGELGSPPNNIDPTKYQLSETMPDNFLPLRWGVDSLYLSYKGDMTQNARERFEELKAFAQNPEKQHLAQVNARGMIFTVADKGRGRFRYLLKGSCFEIQLCDTESPLMPVAYVKVISEYLTHKKPVEAEAELRSILELFCSLDGGHKISRADLFLDFCCCDQDIIDIDPNQFITRAEVIRPYYTNRELTGYDVGLGGDLSARLYNKTLQILTSKQDYLKPLWADGGWQEDETVWRVEFQMRRPVLDRFLVTKVQDLLRHRSELWTYLTRDWLRLSVPNDDSNRSRWPLHPLWVGVWDGGCGALDVPMQKRPCQNSAPDMSAILQSLCQPLSGLFALQNITEFKAGLEWLSQNLGKLLIDHTTSKGLRLDFYVTESIKKKIRDYNLRLNDETLGNSGNFYR